MKRIPLIAALLCLQATLIWGFMQSPANSPQSAAQTVEQQIAAPQPAVDETIEPALEPPIIEFPSSDRPQRLRPVEIINPYVEEHDYIQEFLDTLETRKGCPCGPPPRRTLMDRMLGE